MTIHTRTPGKWRRGAAAVAAATAVVAGGLLGVTPAQADPVDVTFSVEAKGGQNGGDKCKNNTVIEGKGTRPIDYKHERAEGVKDGDVFLYLNCFGTSESSGDGGGGGAFTRELVPPQEYCDPDDWEGSTAGKEWYLEYICTEAGLLPPYAWFEWVNPSGTQSYKAVGNRPVDDSVVGDNGVSYSSVTDPVEGEEPTPPVVAFRLNGELKWGIPVTNEPVQKAPPPPPCWDASINNCPVGGALRFVAPEYAMVGVPVTMYAYASWRPDANSSAQPTNGTAVIRVDGEDYSGVEFVDGVAEWRFIPETEGMKEFTASGVLFSGLSGANAYIDTVPARTYVLEYNPKVYATVLKNKAVEVGDTYVITDPNQARSYLEDRYAWSVSDKSDDVCAVYETKKGAVKAKFNGEGKCTVIWLDKESDESGKYTFIAKK